MSILLLFLGLAIGSFLNVCIYRIPRNQSIAFPPSSCPSCGSEIKWYELFPVFSYIFLKGKCSTCKAPISWRYPLVEAITGVLFVWTYNIFGISFDTLTLSILASLMLVVALTDIDHRIIPNKIVIFGLIVGVILDIVRFGLNIKFILIGIAVGFGFMFLVFVLSRGQMGMGDVKLAAVMGVFLGWQGTLVALFLAFALGSVYGIILMVFFGKSRKAKIPFGPFMALATVIAYVWATDIVVWYLNTLV